MGANGRKTMYTPKERRERHLTKVHRRLKDLKKIRLALAAAHKAISNHDWGNLVGNQGIFFTESEVDDMIAAQELLGEYVK